MIPPIGVSHNTGEACKLRETLYGLKEATEVWFEMFYIVIGSPEFRSIDCNFVLFLKTTSHGYIILSLYIDNMIITRDDIDEILELKLQLAKQFKMKDLGPLHYSLGIEVAYSSRGYFLFQSKYNVIILAQTRLPNTRTSNIPLCWKIPSSLGMYVFVGQLHLKPIDFKMKSNIILEPIRV